MTRTGTTPRNTITSLFDALTQARIQAVLGALAIALYSAAISTSLIDFVLRFAVTASFAALAIWCLSVWWSVYKIGTKRNSTRGGTGRQA